VTRKPRPDLANQTVYYAGWGSYEIPFVPQDPLSEEDALQRGTYYVGAYDADGRLARFEKFLDGTREWTDEYVYWSNGRLRERVMYKQDGSQTVQRFDERGRLTE
jgi:hypothetical protein